MADFLDEHYAARAQLIGTKKITKAKELRESLEKEVPTDSQFEQAFATARVSKQYLARYYLRALDKTLKDDPEPEFVANDDYDAANLEHIIPVNPSSDWKISAEDAANAQQMIGNLTLLSAKKNVALANSAFAEKLKVYKDSWYAYNQSARQIRSAFWP